MSARTTLAAFLLLAVACIAAAPAPQPAAVDPRFTAIRSLYEGSGFSPPATSEQWQARAQSIRQQVLLAAGLWPLPQRTPLNATIHSPIDRDDYTVEKVFFQSYPGFYVTGNLYRPKGKTGPFPAVLCPHGHWANGRFYQNSDAEVDRELKAGTEKDASAARFPLQARCANLAKLGCIVFHYDMVGYADADPLRFPHRNTYRDAESFHLGLNVLGLQLWNSMRSIDLLQSLPDVDKNRIACTGASGGGTQTFLLMATDDRLAVAAPVCMISAGDHQGGCVCENAPLLRLFTDNVEIAASFAPKPFVHPTATGDWTAKFMEQGLPEIQAVYKLFGASANIRAQRFTAGHNYNLNSRELVYNFFNEHLKLGHPSPVKEQAFQPIPPSQLPVFDADHPRPKDSVDAAALKQYLADAASKQIQALRPTDPASLARFRAVLAPALGHTLSTRLPAPDGLLIQKLSAIRGDGWLMEKLLISRRGELAHIPATLIWPGKAQDKPRITLVVHPKGRAGLFQADDAPGEFVQQLLKSGQAVLAADIFNTGELVAPASYQPKKVEFFSGYNRTATANQTHDILTLIAASATRQATVNVLGLDECAVPCALARAVAGDSPAIGKTAIDGRHFSTGVKVPEDPRDPALPGIGRFGGLWALASLAAPADMLIFGQPAGDATWLTSAYTAAGAGSKLTLESAWTAPRAIGWLAR